MKLAFVGAAEVSHGALSAICASGHVPELVVTLPPELAHRRADFFNLSPLAKRYDIPVHYTAKSDSAGTIRVLKKLEPDLIVVVGWSQIFNAEFRSIPKIGCIGFHPSALPRLRGFNVIPWTILKGERDVGASFFWLSEGANDGPIAAQARYAVNPQTVTARELYDRALRALTGLLPQLLIQIKEGDIPAEPQPMIGASSCPGRRTKDDLIDWRCSAGDVHRLIRAFGPPYSGAYTQFPNGSKLVLKSAEITPVEETIDGLPGQVLWVSEKTFIVSCGDRRSLEITEWSGADVPPTLNSQLGSLS